MGAAIITGASQGLGRALADGLAGAGFDLVVDARTAADLEAAAEGLRADHPATRVRAVAGDVTDPDHRADLVAAAWDLGGLDVLVLNAGALGPSPLPRLAEVGLDDLTAVLATNVVAQLGLVQAALPLLERSRGTIVAITSDAAVEGYEGWGAYGASKAALEQLANVLAAEHPDLAVHRVDPGDLRTRMHQDAFPGEDISDRPRPETVVPGLVDLITHRRPSGRHRAADLLAAAASGVGVGGAAAGGTGVDQ